MPEIVVLNLLADIIEALGVLAREGIKHENVSPQTIFVDYKNNWLLSTPNDKVISLARRVAEKQENLGYLVAPEVFDQKSYDPFTADLFSLGVAVIDSFNPFDESLKGKQLSEQAISTSLDYFRVYYSKQLIALLKDMTRIDSAQRLNLAKAQRAIDALRDL